MNGLFSGRSSMNGTGWYRKSFDLSTGKYFRIEGECEPLIIVQQVHPHMFTLVQRLLPPWLANVASIPSLV